MVQWVYLKEVTSYIIYKILNIVLNFKNNHEYFFAVSKVFILNVVKFDDIIVYDPIKITF